MRKIAFLFALVWLPLTGFSQRTIRDSMLNIPLIGAQYAFQVPGGDLSQRFGLNSTIGASFYYKMKSNWLIGAEFNFLFGSKVKEDPTQSIATSQGFIINGYGEPQLMELYERGIIPMLKAGRIFPVWGPNKNSGIFVKAGAGYMQHKIRYYWAQNGPPQLQGDYVKGYDRLTSGMAISESAGYLHLSNRNLLNFSAELELTQGFTQNRRAWNFDEMLKDDTKRLDLLYGVKIHWYFPVYKKSSEQYIY